MQHAQTPGHIGASLYRAVLLTYFTTGSAGGNSSGTWRIRMHWEQQGPPWRRRTSESNRVAPNVNIYAKEDLRHGNQSKNG